MMTPFEIARTEPVDFDEVQVGDWIMPAWPHHPEGPPWRVGRIDEQDGRRLLLEGAHAPTIGPSRPQEWIVGARAWRLRAASHEQWLRLPGLRDLEAALMELKRLTDSVIELEQMTDGVEQERDA